MEVTARYENLDGETITTTLENVSKIERDQPNDGYYEFRVYHGGDMTILEEIVEVIE